MPASYFDLLALDPAMPARAGGGFRPLSAVRAGARTC